MTRAKTNIDKKQKQVTLEEEGCVWPQILAILIGSLGGFTNGVIFAWTSPFIVKLVADKEIYNISENEANSLTIIQPITSIFSTILLSRLPDIIGRKKTLLLVCFPQVLCLATSAFAKSIYIFYLARVFAGIGNAFLWSAFPMYIGEVASPSIRNVWGNALTSALNIGQFLVNVVGSYCDIPTTSYIFLPAPLLLFIFFMYMPETPYFYLMKNDLKNAKKSLKFLTRKSNVDADVMKLKSDVERQMSESATWKDLFFIDSNRKALLAGFFLRLSQQFAGVTVFVQYTQYFFKTSGGTVNPQVASMIFNGLCIFLNIFVVFFVIKRFKRKVLFATSLILTAFTLFIMSVYFYLQEMSNIDLSSFDWLPITSMVIYQIVTSFGLQVIPTLMTGELFSASIKTKAMMVLICCMAVGVFLANAVFNLLNLYIGFYSPFLFFGLCSGCATILSLHLIPDTKGKTLEEIQMSLKAKK